VRAALAVVESHTAGNGLMACMDQLTAAGTFIDTFLSLRLQFTVMRIFARLLKFADAQTLHLACACGLVRQVDKYLQAALAVAQDVPRLHQQGLFAKQYADFAASLREIWSVLVGSHDLRVYEDMLDLGLLRRLVQEWAPCGVSIVFGSTDPDYNTLVIRAEAVKMLQTVVLHMPRSERLVAELARCILTSHTVGRELATLTSPGTKRGPSGARRLAAEMLCAIAALGMELIDQEMMDLGIPKYLLELSTHFGCLHAGMPAAWLRWGQNQSLSQVSKAVVDADVAEEVQADILELFEDRVGPQPLAATSEVVQAKMKGSTLLYCNKASY